MNITDFLLARIAEDEAAAREAMEVESRLTRQPAAGPRRVEWSWHVRVLTWIREPYVRENAAFLTDMAQSIAPTPARMLAECAAKRAIVEHLDSLDSGEFSGWLEFAERPIRLMARAYRDHAEYRPAWDGDLDLCDASTF